MAGDDDNTGRPPRVETALWTLPEVMAITHLSRATIERLIAVEDGRPAELPSVKVGARRMVRNVDLRAWIDALPTAVS